MPIQPNSDLGFGDELAPQFDIVIEGKNASAATPLFNAIRPLIAGVSYEEDEAMATLFELTVVNHPSFDPGKPIDWKEVIDCKAFQEGNGIDLFMGYAGKTVYMGRTEIVKWMPSGDSQGTNKFTIKGYDGRHKMMLGNQFVLKQPVRERAAKGKKPVNVSKHSGGESAGKKGKGGGQRGRPQKLKHVYTSMPDDQIVKKVAAKYGYLADCDPVDKSVQAKGGTGSKSKNNMPSQTPAFNMPQVQNQPEIKKYNCATGTCIEVVPLPPGVTKRKKSSSPSRIQTSHQTDWQFLQKLATINRFDLWVDYDLGQKNWVVNFKQKQDYGEAFYSFSYNGNDGSLLSWEIEFAITEQPNSVEVVYFDTSKRTIEITSIEDASKEEDVNFGTASPGNFSAKKTIGKGARVRFTAFGQALEAVANRPFRSRKEAEKFVYQWLKDREKDFLVLKGKVIAGVEPLRPRQIHEFLGMSARCDGLYRLTQCKYKMEAGSPYVCEFVAYKVLSQEVSRRKAVSKTGVKSKKRPLVSGGGKIEGRNL